MRQVYEKAFSDPQYNSGVSQTGQYRLIRDTVKRFSPATVIDVGSGRGNVLKAIHADNPGIVIDTVDLKNFHGLQFVKTHYDLDVAVDSVEHIGKHDLAICADVLEHIPMESINRVLSSVKSMGINHVFTIANHSDVNNGVELHLIREAILWWTRLIEQHFIVIESGTMIPERLFYFICRSNGRS